MKISAVITTYNEESNIRKCLESLVGWMDEIVLVDGTSVDNTVKIAREFTDKIFVRPNQVVMKINNQYGIEHASGDWILLIDADEWVSKELSDEIIEAVKSDEFQGYYVPRRNIVFGKWMKYGGHYPDYQLRLFKREKSTFAGLHVHENVIINGQLGYLKKPLDHFNYKDINHHLKKLIFYTDFESQYFFQESKRLTYLNVLWYLFFRPLAKSFRRYLLKGGFRNGLAGFIFEVHCIFLEFTIFSKLWELQNNDIEKGTK